MRDGPRERARDEMRRWCTRAAPLARITRQNGPEHLPATALVHEAYCGSEITQVKCSNRASALGLAAVMRRRIMGNTAATAWGKRGGHAERIPLSGIEVSGAPPDVSHRTPDALNGSRRSIPANRG